MERITISLSKELAGLARQKADQQKRSTSSYVALLIEQDAARVAAIKESSARIAAVTATLRQDPTALAAVETALARRRIRQRTARKAA